MALSPAGPPRTVCTVTQNTCRLILYILYHPANISVKSLACACVPELCVDFILEILLSLLGYGLVVRGGIRLDCPGQVVNDQFCVTLRGTSAPKSLGTSSWDMSAMSTVLYLRLFVEMRQAFTQRGASQHRPRHVYHFVDVLQREVLRARGSSWDKEGLERTMS